MIQTWLLQSLWACTSNPRRLAVTHSITAVLFSICPWLPIHLFLCCPDCCELCCPSPNTHFLSKGTTLSVVFRVCEADWYSWALNACSFLTPEIASLIIIVISQHCSVPPLLKSLPWPILSLEISCFYLLLLYSTSHSQVCLPELTVNPLIFFLLPDLAHCPLVVY